MSQDGPKQDKLDQVELDQLLALNGFLTDESNETDRKHLIEEIKDAVLDSGKLSLREWRALREKLREIEMLVPHIDLIIELKSKRRDQSPLATEKVSKKR